MLDCWLQDSVAELPMMLVSTPGFDPSGKVDALADGRALPFKSYSSLALGSSEADSVAESSVVTASKEGSWILLRNVHLCPELLVRLEKRLHSLKPHANFRLFLTSEMHPCLPVPLLRMSRVVVFEAPSGVVAALRKCLQQVPVARMDRTPSARARLYFNLAWCHAVVLERLRYRPIGWTKGYEFSDTDFQVGLDVIDAWLVSREQHVRRWVVLVSTPLAFCLLLVVFRTSHLPVLRM